MSKMKFCNIVRNALRNEKNYARSDNCFVSKFAQVNNLYIVVTPRKNLENHFTYMRRA